MSNLTFTHNIRPNCLNRIGQCDRNIGRAEEKLTTPNITKDQLKLIKLTIKAFTAEKAFMICACNRDKVGCQKWFDKTNERSLLVMEQLEKLVNDENDTTDEDTYLYFCNICAKTFHKNASWIMDRL